MNTQRIEHFFSGQRVLVLSIALICLIVVAILAVGNGTLEISPTTTMKAILHGLGNQPLETQENIIWNTRLPRVALGGVVGAALAISGAAMQGLFRNPLADPYLMGSASGAALGATLAIFATNTAAAAFATSLTTNITPFIPLAAFCGALGAVLFTLILSRSSNRINAVLAGVVVGSLLTAIATYIQLHDADRMRAVFSWTLGNLTFASWDAVIISGLFFVFGLITLLAIARGLDALQLGEDTAQTLGLSLTRLRLITLLAISLMTGAAVAFAGIIGFVGLVAPHIMRRLGRPTHRFLFFTSGLAGASLLILSDLGARVLIRPGELPVGIVTTVLGAPVFLWLIRR